ncbi:SCY1 protein kinase [Anopheles sinensis]|uniref:SCY1 protein kinase n=1 Tax=Anopheles sinensis TaxID=74873 RepID=A0A084VQ18_ANOSI|nr:SCY1 protein kinase [Anopheles sinensis]
MLRTQQVARHASQHPGAPVTVLIDTCQSGHQKRAGRLGGARLVEAVRTTYERPPSKSRLSTSHLLMDKLRGWGVLLDGVDDAEGSTSFATTQTGSWPQRGRPLRRARHWTAVTHLVPDRRRRNVLFASDAINIWMYARRWSPVWFWSSFRPPAGAGAENRLQVGFRLFSAPTRNAISHNDIRVPNVFL